MDALRGTDDAEPLQGAEEARPVDRGGAADVARALATAISDPGAACEACGTSAGKRFARCAFVEHSSQGEDEVCDGDEVLEALPRPTSFWQGCVYEKPDATVRGDEERAAEAPGSQEEARRGVHEKEWRPLARGNDGREDDGAGR